MRDSQGQPTPVRTLLLVWAALLGLAAASFLAWNAGMWVWASEGALAIATAKAALVAAFFMRLGGESRALRWILLILPAIVLLLFGLTMLDVAWR